MNKILIRKIIKKSVVCMCCQHQVHLYSTIELIVLTVVTEVVTLNSRFALTKSLPGEY